MCVRARCNSAELHRATNVACTADTLRFWPLPTYCPLVAPRRAAPRHTAPCRPERDTLFLPNSCNDRKFPRHCRGNNRERVLASGRPIIPTRDAGCSTGTFPRVLPPPSSSPCVVPLSSNRSKSRWNPATLLPFFLFFLFCFLSITLLGIVPAVLSPFVLSLSSPSSSRLPVKRLLESPRYPPLSLRRHVSSQPG